MEQYCKSISKESTGVYGSTCLELFRVKAWIIRQTAWYCTERKMTKQRKIWTGIKQEKERKYIKRARKSNKHARFYVIVYPDSHQRNHTLTLSTHLSALNTSRHPNTPCHPDPSLGSNIFLLPTSSRSMKVTISLLRHVFHIGYIILICCLIKSRIETGFELSYALQRTFKDRCGYTVASSGHCQRATMCNWWEKKKTFIMATGQISAHGHRPAQFGTK